MDEDMYVTADTWLRRAGRPDLIDDVADQFERDVAQKDTPVPVGAGRTGYS